MALLTLLCSALASHINVKSASDPTRASILEVCRELAPLEPEFILKVCGMKEWEEEVNRVTLMWLSYEELVTGSWWGRSLGLNSRGSVEWRKVPWGEVY